MTGAASALSIGTLRGPLFVFTAGAPFFSKSPSFNGGTGTVVDRVATRPPESGRAVLAVEARVFVVPPPTALAPAELR